MRLSRHLEEALKNASEEAKSLNHEFITLEHILLAFSYSIEGRKIIEGVGGDLENLIEDLQLFLEEDIEAVPDNVDFEPQYTLGTQMSLQFAAMHVQAAERTEITIGNVLAAIFRQQESHAVYLLKKQGISRLEITRYISHGISKNPTSKDIDQDKEEEKKSQIKKSLLDEFCVNLNEKAKAGKIDPLIGRKKELERTIQVLARRRKNNPIYVGDAGVGKTAIAEGVAHAIVSGSVPEQISHMQIYALDMGSLLAGTKFRGDFEERVRGILDLAKKKPEIVLFIDEIHSIIGAGSTNGGALDASNLLKPALSAGELKCIGTTTYKEYRTIFEKDHALSRRFQKIDVPEPTQEEAEQIVKGLLPHYEKFHRVSYSKKVVKEAVGLTHRFISDRRLPDKVIDVIDESGAMVKLRGSKSVTVSDIETIVGSIAKVPSRNVKKNDRDRLKNLRKNLKEKIYGQDQAVDIVVDSILLSRSGLREEDKPVGSFLFAGPTGVGKTELAKQIAEELEISFLRFDMSEYMEKHTISRLIGSPPGYVGFDQGGQLTDAVNQNAHSIILLDEIEKAHHDIDNILLQIMDHATLTDNNGRKSDFRHAIVVMTTNSGAREMMSSSLGFDEKTETDKSKKAIEDDFSPEFRNRLDAIVQFSNLSDGVIAQIVDKVISELNQRLAKQKTSVLLTENAKSYLIKGGYDKKFGARPIKRLVENEIAKPLSQKLLFDGWGGEVEVDFEPNKNDKNNEKDKDKSEKLTLKLLSTISNHR